MKECPNQVYFKKDPSTGTCYFFHAGATHWSDAGATCAGMTGSLASPSTNAELTFLSDWGVVPSNFGAWLGASDAATEGSWLWSDGTAWTYPVSQGVAPWASGEPNGGTNENCLELLSSYTFNDLGCTELLSSFCEFPEGLGGCGDGALILELGEACDDGNTNDGDGCSASCQGETGFDCSSTSPSVCVLAESCWDGIDNDWDNAIDTNDSDCALPVYLPACGAGETQLVYNTFLSTAVIPDGSATGLSRTFGVSANGTIASVSLVVNITHAWDSDVDISLTAPGGAPINISSDNGGSAQDYTDTVFNSACTTPILYPAHAPFSGCYKPEGSLTGLTGQSAQGTWTLNIADDAEGDTGALNKAFLVLCVNP